MPLNFFLIYLKTIKKIIKFGNKKNVKNVKKKLFNRFSKQEKYFNIQ